MTLPLDHLLGLSGTTLASAFAVFLRVAAVMFFLPGFGERTVSVRVRLVIALALTMVVLPAVAPKLISLLETRAVGTMVLSETVAGLAVGALLRLFVFVLQMVGTMAAQATSLSQIFGGATIDPQPAMGHVLLVAGLALAMMAGLHVRVIEYLLLSYDVFPPGELPDAAWLRDVSIKRIGAAFALAFTLSAPFVIASLLYNLALGAINRAMPQLMVSFVGAPAITAAGLALLAVASPVLLSIWVQAMNAFLAGGGF